MLQSLLELARQTSPESRRDVLHALSQLFVDGASAHSERELELFGDILVRLLDQAPEIDRLAIARRVARTDETPHELALKLARDEALIAAPILEFSPALTVADLVELAGGAGQDQLLSLSRRANIVAPVTDVIVDRGEIVVLNTLTRNLTARFSNSGIERVGMRAMSAPLLADALSLRPDLPVPVARRIITAVSPAARERVEALLRQNGDRVADLMGRAVQLLDLARSEQNQHRGDVRKMLADIRSSHRRLDDAVEELVFRKRLADVAMLFADLAGLPEQHVNTALHKINAAHIGVVARVLGIGDPTFRRLSSLRCEKLRLPMSQADQMLRDYAVITLERAEHALRFYRRPKPMPAARA